MKEKAKKWSVWVSECLGEPVGCDPCVVCGKDIKGKEVMFGFNDGEGPKYTHMKCMRVSTSEEEDFKVTKAMKDFFTGLIKSHQIIDKVTE